MTTVGKVLSEVDNLIKLSDRFSNAINKISASENEQEILKTLSQVGLYMADLKNTKDILLCRAYQLKGIVDKTEIEL